MSKDATAKFHYCYPDRHGRCTTCGVLMTWAEAARAKRLAADDARRKSGGVIR